MVWARSLLLHRAIVAALIVCALAVRLLVPAGYMPAVVGGSLRLELCSGTAPAAPAPVAMAGMHHAPVAGTEHGPPKPDAPASAGQPCAFAGLAAAALGSADPLLLASALAFVVLLAVRGRALRLPAPPPRLRPPLRAPPLPV